MYKTSTAKTEFIRAVQNDAKDIYYPEMLAEFPDTDINIYDGHRRTALRSTLCMRDGIEGYPALLVGTRMRRWSQRERRPHGVRPYAEG